MAQDDTNALQKLRSETELIHLLYFRNKNQHRVARWWGQFSMLHRKCAQLIENGRPLHKCTKQVDFIVWKLAPSAYRAFQSVLAQGQFVALGFALTAALARIYSVLLPFATPKRAPVVPVAEVESVSKGPAGGPGLDLDLDLGQSVSREVIRKRSSPDVDLVGAKVKRAKRETEDGGFPAIADRTDSLGPGYRPVQATPAQDQQDKPKDKSKDKPKDKSKDKPKDKPKDQSKEKHRDKTKEKKKKKKNAIDDIFGF